MEDNIEDDNLLPGGKKGSKCINDLCLVDDNGSNN